VLVSATQGTDFHGKPTALFELGPSGGAAGARTLKLELSEAFDFDKPGLAADHDGASGGRGQAPAQSAPRVLRHFGGLPSPSASSSGRSTSRRSGATPISCTAKCTSRRQLEQSLRQRLAASVTLTFAEIVPAMEQPYAETFVYNAVRKTVDLGQLEFLKSGNRQPVPVTTRFYSRWQKKFCVHRYGRHRAAELPAKQGVLALRSAGKASPCGLPTRATRNISTRQNRICSARPAMRPCRPHRARW